MRTWRAIIIPAMLTLGVSGSTVAGAAFAVAGGHLHPHLLRSHVQSGSAANPNIDFHAKTVRFPRLPVLILTLRVDDLAQVWRSSLPHRFSYAVSQSDVR